MGTDKNIKLHIVTDIKKDFITVSKIKMAEVQQEVVAEVAASNGDLKENGTTNGVADVKEKTSNGHTEKVVTDEVPAVEENNEEKSEEKEEKDEEKKEEKVEDTSAPPA